MLSCEKCLKLYSEKLESCPHCKHKGLHKKGCVILLGSALLATVGIVYLIKQVPPESPEKAAPIWCQTFIQQRLNDPGSAEFDRTALNLPATKNDDGSYSALIEVRANNAFGAKVKAHYWCTVKPGALGGDAWKPISIVQAD